MLAKVNQTNLQSLKRLNFGIFGYVPQAQQDRVHRSRAKVIVISGGEGSGKSKVTAEEIAGRYGTWRRVLLVAYKFGSEHNESDYLFESLSSIGAVSSYSCPKSSAIELVTRDGAIVESVSTAGDGERAVSGTGKSYDIIVMCEAGKQPYAVFLACLLRISRTDGLLILSGTIEKSEPWFPDVVTRLQAPNELNAEVVIIPTWDNLVLYPLGRDDPKIKAVEKELGKDLFLERCAGKPSVPAALIFKEFSHLTHVFEWCKYDESVPVQVAVDPGYSGSHYSVNFIQEHPRAWTRQFAPFLPDASLTDVFVIGDLFLDHTTHEEVIKLCKEREPYKTWYPRITGGVGDVVMKTHPMADRAPVDVWLEKGGLFLRGQLVGIDDGINRHHTFLLEPDTGKPRLFFNPQCTGAPHEYAHWKRKEVGEGMYGDPEDKNCDAMKAIQYYLIDRFGRVDRAPRPPHAKSRSQRDEIAQRLYG